MPVLPNASIVANITRQYAAGLLRDEHSHQGELPPDVRLAKEQRRPLREPVGHRPA